MLAGVSTRKFARVGEPVGLGVETEASATGRSSVSELFVQRTRTALEELMSRRLNDVRLAVTMLDGMEVAEATHVVALGISTEGVKIPLGLWEGSTENATPDAHAAGRSPRPRPGSENDRPGRVRRLPPRGHRRLLRTPPVTRTG